MKQIKCVFAVVSLFFLMGVSSCFQGDKTETLLKEDIIGKWEYKEGLQGGQEIRSGRMDGVFFHFRDDDTLVTNFNLDVQPKAWSYKIEADNAIVVKGSGMEQNRLEKNLDGQLLLRTVFMDVPFDLTLERQGGATE